MQKIQVKNSVISGDVTITGAKNALLPQMAASLLTTSVVHMRNVPNLLDTKTMTLLMEELGSKIEFNKNSASLSINNSNINKNTASKSAVQSMRASVLTLGAMLAKYKHFKVPYPGGCNLGLRNIDMHIFALKALGADIRYEGDYICATAENGLIGADIFFPYKTVGATEQAIIAAVLAKGDTRIINAAIEPEITALIDMLNDMGADIKGANTPIITISGVNELQGTEVNIIGDRIEAASYICASLATSGSITLNNINPNHLSCVISALKETGCTVETTVDSIYVDSTKGIKAVSIDANPYPGFPTDIQPLWAAAMLKAEGHSLITDNIFENRFSYVDDLIHMGANIKILNNHSILVSSAKEINGYNCSARDLRGGFALIIAGLSASGVTSISNIDHIYRGYSDMISKITQLNGHIELIN